MGALLPQSRTCAVQTEAAIQSDIGLIRTLGRVFLNHLRKGVQQGVAILFCKFRMPRVFELPINRNNIATVDRSELTDHFDLLMAQNKNTVLPTL